MIKRDWHSDEFNVIVTLGESITAGGWSSSRERCWTERLAALINDIQSHPVRLVNSGIGANVISTRSPGYEHSGKPAANERLEKHVIAHKPDLVIISYGMNDARSGTPLGLFIAEMESLIDYIRAGCVPLIILLGPYFMTDFGLGGEPWSHGSPQVFETYNKSIAGLAAAKECLYVDLLASYDRAEWMVHRDGVHTNDLGHLVVANKIFEVLAQNCSGLARYTKEKESKIQCWRDESTLIADYGYTLTVIPEP